MRLPNITVLAVTDALGSTRSHAYMCVHVIRAPGVCAVTAPGPWPRHLRSQAGVVATRALDNAIVARLNLSANASPYMWASGLQLVQRFICSL